MQVTNQTNQDYWFGPLHLPAGVGTQITVDDTSATSLYLTDDAVADAINNLSNQGKILVTSAASPFPRPTGVPQLLHGDGSPEGLVYAPQGSLYMRRDNSGASSSLYAKTTGVTFNTGWQAISADVLASPTGAIHMYAAATAPTGWLLCDGSAVSRTTYSNLFGVISTTYGAGDGSTTFNVPDLRGRAPVGFAASGGHVDVSTLGNSEGVAVANRRPKHRTSMNDPGHTHGVTNPGTEGSGFGNAFQAGTNANGFQTNAGAVTIASSTTGITVGTGVSSDALDSPAYLVVNHIIKT